MARYYTLERYQVVGSRILSRSFQVTKWEGEGDEDEETDDDGDAGAVEANTSVDSAAMDVDEQENHEQPTEEGDSDDEDEDDPADVAMVPVADMLNARYETENVGLTRLQFGGNGTANIAI